MKYDIKSWKINKSDIGADKTLYCYDEKKRLEDGSFAYLQDDTIIYQDYESSYYVGSSYGFSECLESIESAKKEFDKIQGEIVTYDSELSTHDEMMVLDDRTESELLICPICKGQHAIEDTVNIEVYIDSLEEDLQKHPQGEEADYIIDELFILKHFDKKEIDYVCNGCMVAARKAIENVK